MAVEVDISVVQFMRHRENGAAYLSVTWDVAKGHLILGQWDGVHGYMPIETHEFEATHLDVVDAIVHADSIMNEYMTG